MNAKQRYANRANAKRLKPEPVCQNCGMRGRHYVPPSFGEAGFYACKYLKQMNKVERTK